MPPRSPAPADLPASTRERLLQAGVARAKQHGLRALTVRAVAGDAGVNLGSFVYHFGSREAFIAELIEHWYAPLMERTRDLLVEMDPKQAGLRGLVMGIADWMLAERAFVGHLTADAAAGEPAARAFLLSSGDRHPAIVLQAVVEAQARGQLRQQEDPVHILLALLALVGLPVLLFEAMNGRSFMPPEFAAAFESYAMDREHVARRLDWMLKGLAP
ncbi:MAG: TetR/AcrR family transcriptional regulator [Aquabacterium sp.]|nr:MAG: TetR/AcrR family transcriptional regulator [Aquabacterium sp.]